MRLVSHAHRPGSDKILAAIRPGMRVLEIGPSIAPILPKRDGWDTCVVDHASKEELVDKYRPHANVVDLSRIEDVDVVWTEGPLDVAVRKTRQEAFDACVACHVLEHLPDPVGFLKALEKLLSPSGVVSLVIPDKRFCFDFFKPLSTVGALLEAHRQLAARHARHIVFDFEAYNVTSRGRIVWGVEPVTDLAFWKSLEDAKKVFDTYRSTRQDPYVDCHAWHFTPSSFEMAMLELAALGEIALSVDRAFPTQGFEFYVTLRRGRDVPKKEQDLDARRLELLRATLAEVGAQAELLHERVKSDRSDGNARNASAEQFRIDVLERQLDTLLSSRSWRLTAPLRFVGHQLRRVGGKTP
jgi:hypothetical protein